MVVTSLKTLDEIHGRQHAGACRSDLDHRALAEGLGRRLRRPHLRRHQGLFLELDQDGRPGGADLDAARRAQRLRADQVALPRPTAGLRPDAVRLLHPVPVGADPDGDDPGQLGRSAPRSGFDRFSLRLRQSDRQSGASSTSSTASASRRCSSATTTRRSRPNWSRRRRSTAPASSRSSGASCCRTRCRSSSSR